jgi:hypothetical protein
MGPQSLGSDGRQGAGDNVGPQRPDRALQTEPTAVPRPLPYGDARSPARQALKTAPSQAPRACPGVRAASRRLTQRSENAAGHREAPHPVRHCIPRHHRPLTGMTEAHSTRQHHRQYSHPLTRSVTRREQRRRTCTPRSTCRHDVQDAVGMRLHGQNAYLVPSTGPLHNENRPAVGIDHRAKIDNRDGGI